MPPPTPNSEEPLNAPFGARCFLARYDRHVSCALRCVLMHLLALGAFWHKMLNFINSALIGS